MSLNTLDNPSGKPSILDSMTDCYLLHSGGESSIYKVSADGRDCVLKWYKPGISFNKDVLETLENSRISNLYKVVEFGERDGSAYLVYDFVDGASSDCLGRIPVPVALQALRYVAFALGRTSKLDVSHGDLHPSNVIFTAAEKNGSLELCPMLIDFGIVGPGALAYAAPERFLGKQPSEKSDLFSLGLLLYRWISGSDLIEANGYDDFASKVTAVGDINVSEKLYLGLNLDPESINALDPLWQGLLATDPENRVEDFDELDELLEIALGKVSGGEVALLKGIQSFLQQEILPKSGTKVSPETKCDLPYTICGTSRKKRLGWKAPIAVLVLIFLLVALGLYFGTRGSDIDATGEMLLMQSRSLNAEAADSVTEPVTTDSVQIKEMLQNLPTPASE